MSFTGNNCKQIEHDTFVSTIAFTERNVINKLIVLIMKDDGGI